MTSLRSTLITAEIPPSLAVPADGRVVNLTAARPAPARRVSSGEKVGRASRKNFSGEERKKRALSLCRWTSRPATALSPSEGSRPRLRKCRTLVGRIGCRTRPDTGGHERKAEESLKENVLGGLRAESVYHFPEKMGAECNKKSDAAAADDWLSANETGGVS
ncbi:hypothetical protein KM043_000500 [Ampulex compressa]|nr:hypothetical protein KM043_000500 [Ampulex compressa]